MKSNNPISRIIIVFILLLFSYSCAVNPVTGKKQIMLMTEAQEVQMGAEYDPQVVATFGEYHDAQLLSFIQGKTDEMGRISHRPNLKYHVKILDSPVVNAFAVPGGYLYLTRGILAQFTNEAELIGVIGHEMGHVTARHSVSQQSKQTLGQLLLIGGMVASEKFASYAQYAMQGMQLLFLKFSRDDEREADALGVEYSSKIGYDAAMMAEFFNVLEKMSMPADQGGVPTFLSTHPSPADRYQAVNRQAKSWQDSLGLTSYKVNTDSYLQMIDGIIYGDDPRQGYVDGNTFYHPELKFKFSYPAGWKFQNLPTQINMAPSDGKALMVFSMAGGSSLQEASTSALGQLNLKAEETSSVTVNGMPAIITLSKQVNQDKNTGEQHTNLILSYFIDYGGKYFAFHGVSSEGDYPSYTEVFKGTMGNFAKLSDPARINVTPNRLLVKKVQRSGSLSDALKYYGTPQEKMSELALLNNLELTSQVKAGQLIKVIGK